MSGGTPASVLVAICGSDMRVLLTKKAAKLRIHAGQISFPGGKPEKGDIDLAHTAIRETREESGLDVKREQILANLDDVRTLGTGYVITPYVCVLEKPFGKLTINDEVERIYSPKLYDLFQTRTTDTVHDIQGSVEFAIKDEIIWGASALAGIFFASSGFALASSTLDGAVGSASYFEIKILPSSVLRMRTLIFLGGLRIPLLQIICETSMSIFTSDIPMWWRANSRIMFMARFALRLSGESKTFPKFMVYTRSVSADNLTKPRMCMPPVSAFGVCSN